MLLPHPTMRVFAILVSVFLLIGGVPSLVFSSASGQGIDFASNEIPASDLTTSEGWYGSEETECIIHLKYAEFDPIDGEPFIPLGLSGDAADVALVQFNGPVRSEWRDELTRYAKILTFVKDHTFIVHPMDIGAIQGMDSVRWVGPYHPAYRIHEDLLASMDMGIAEGGGTGVGDPALKGDLPMGPQNITIKLFFGACDPIVVSLLIEEMGIEIIDAGILTWVITARANVELLPYIAALPWVEYIEPVGDLFPAMDLIREYTGADDLLDVPFDGTGVVGEIKDNGIDQDHVEFVDQLIGTDGTVSEESHGTATFGIVFAKGVNEQATGMAPGSKGVFCDWAVDRYQSIMNLVNNWDGVFQSNSWYQGETDSSYSVMSWEDDQTILDFDVTMLYATGNGGAAQACSQDAVAKNVIAVGGIRHGNNVNWDDDRHTGGQGNRGPADDMRIKPDLCGPYESIYTTRPGSYTSSFGGTSGATPVNAGGIALVYQMYEENHFGNNPFLERPHSSTVKALAIANAHQYDLAQAERMAQGWGHIDVGTMYELGKRQFIVDEDDPLFMTQDVSYIVAAEPTQPLKITLAWTDVPGSTATTQNLINDLDLTVTSPSGTTYRGNFGLNESMWSLENGTRDDLNNVENVFIESPEKGDWTITITGAEVVMDGDTSSLMIDQPFSLVASGVGRDEFDLLIYDEIIPQYFEPGIRTTITAMVANYGEQDAVDAEVRLDIGGETVATMILPMLASDSAKIVNFTWTPGGPGSQTLQIHVVPVPGEYRLENNWYNGTIRVYHPMGRIMIDLNHSITLPISLVTELMNADFQIYTTDDWIENSTFTNSSYGNITGFMTFEPITSFTADEQEAVRLFIERGGGLLAVGGEDDLLMANLTSFAGIGWSTDDGLLGSTNNIEVHPITQGVNSLTFDTSELTVTATDPAVEVVNDETFIFQNLLVAAAEVGEGTVVGVSDMSVFSDDNLYSDDNLLFALNTADWTNDQIPIVSIAEPGQYDVFTPEQSITFTAGVIDPDSPDPTFSWTSDISGTIGSNESFDVQLDRGIHTITLVVTDDMNLASADVTIIVNSTPSIILTGPVDMAYLQGMVTLRWSASDPEEDAVEFMVELTELDGDGNTTYIDLTEEEGGKEELELRGLSAGFSYEWRVRVTDNYQRVVWSSVEDFRFSNNDPEVVLLAPGVDERIGTGTTTFSWIGSDDDDDPMSYRLFMRTDITELLYEGPETSFSLQDLPGGMAYEWWVEADDGYDVSKTERRWFEVNSIPTLDRIEPFDGSRVGNDPFTLVLIPEDEEGDSIDIELYLDGGEVTIFTTQNNLEYDLFGLEPGTHNWSVMLDDGLDSVTFGPFEFHVNDPPSIEILGPDHREVVNNSFMLTWEAYDLEDDPLAYELFLGRSDEPELHATPSKGEFSDFRYPGTYMWYVTVWDGYTTTRSDTMKFIIPSGPSPEVEILSIGPVPALSNERVTFRSTAEDPDGTIESILWYSDLDGDLSQSLDFDMKGLSPGLHTITLSVMDTEGNIGTESISIEVLDGSLKRPHAALLTPPPPYYFNDYLTFSFLGSYDNDGSVEGYFIDFGDETESGWLTTQSITHRYTQIGNYVLTARVRDDDGLESTNLVKVSISVGIEPLTTESTDKDDFVELLISPAGIAAGTIILLVCVAVALRRKR